MANRKNKIGLAVGSAFAAGMSMVSMAHAGENPFSLKSLHNGYMVADAKTAEAKCGQGKCGGSMMDLNKDGKISKEEFIKSHDSMYGPKDGPKPQFLKAKEAEFLAKDKNKNGFLEAAEEKAVVTPAVIKGAEAKCGQGKCGAMPQK